MSRGSVSVVVSHIVNNTLSVTHSSGLCLRVPAATPQGLIQSVYELSDTSGLVITVGKYLTPRGVDIDRFGIAPDFRSLPDPREAEAALDACRLEASALSGGGSTPSASVSRSGGGAEGGAQQQRVLAGAVPAG